MTLRVPLAKAKVSGLRRLSSRKEMDAALAKLRGRSRAKRTMWSRRAQEYQAKIASGDPASIAEVVRDLYRNAGQPEPKNCFIVGGAIELKIDRGIKDVGHEYNVSMIRLLSCRLADFISPGTTVRSIAEQIQLVIVHHRFGTVGCL